ncbi:transglutaminase domain-containing protein [Ekhidna sp.]|uniref:transglutaminase domain-containing protein n=1 Tax=Ekhidna sp. TaxID=2608089 RepID=UPI003B5B8E26
MIDFITDLISVITRLSYIVLLLLIVGPFQKAHAQVLKNETRITIDNEGVKTTQRKVRIRINNKESNWLSHIEVRHDPKQTFSFNYAQIIDSNGKVVRKLKKKELITRNDFPYQAFHQDDLITEFDLYWNSYPYQIEYSYEVTEEEFLYVTWWTPIIYYSVPVTNAALEVIIPKGYNIQVYKSGDVLFEETQIDQTRKLSWQASASKQPENEIFMPPSNSLIPRVVIVPNNFTYGVGGNTDSWSAFGTWLSELNRGTDNLPYSEKEIVQEMIDGIHNEKEIIRVLYHYLQDHTRYINVAIDVGGLKSYSASYVCTNKYGDCKALTTYMKGLLKVAGIESHYTIIDANKNIENIETSIPSQQFNHVILTVPLQKDTVWLENTSNSLPFNYLGTFTQNRYALAVDSSNSKLIKTPRLKPEDVLIERIYSFSSDAENNWKSDIKIRLRGESFEDFRYYNVNGSNKELNGLIKRVVDLGDFKMKDWESNHHRDSSNVTITTSGEIGDPTRNIGHMNVITPLMIRLPDFEEPKKRDFDVKINYPIYLIDSVKYELKNLNEKKIQLPEGQSIDSEYGEYSSHFEIKNKYILITERFLLKANHIPVKDYEKFYSFIQSIIEYKKTCAIIIK